MRKEAIVGAPAELQRLFNTKSSELPTFPAYLAHLQAWGVAEVQEEEELCLKMNSILVMITSMLQQKFQ